jgi:chromosome segregation ATPase
MTRRQTLLGLGGFDEALGFTPDYAMWLKLCVKGRVAFLSQPLILYRWHGTNASHAYRFEKGIDEGLTARHQALRYYVEQTGRKEEGELLQAVSRTLAASERRVAQLDLQSENQRAYIKDLEHERDQLWAELQRVGKGWEEQQAHIENQRAYIKDLEHERDQLWAELQRVGKGWEEQQAHIENQRAYIKDLEHERDQLATERNRLLSHPLGRLTQKLQGGSR